MDSMRLNSSIVVQILDKGMKLAVSAFIDEQLVAHYEKLYCSKGAHTYTGYADKKLLNKVKRFQGDEFEAFLIAIGIDQKDAGVENYKCLLRSVATVRFPTTFSKTRTSNNSTPRSTYCYNWHSKHATKQFAIQIWFWCCCCSAKCRDCPCIFARFQIERKM